MLIEAFSGQSIATSSVYAMSVHEVFFFRAMVRWVLMASDECVPRNCSMDWLAMDEVTENAWSGMCSSKQLRKQVSQLFRRVGAPPATLRLQTCPVTLRVRQAMMSQKAFCIPRSFTLGCVTAWWE